MPLNLTAQEEQGGQTGQCGGVVEEVALEKRSHTNTEEQITENGTRKEQEERCNDTQRMDTCQKQKEDSTNERMIEEEEEVKKVVSELSTHESSLDKDWQGLRERRVGKDNEDKEDGVDVVDSPEKGQLRLEQTNFIPEKKKLSEGVRLLTYFEAPPHLQFNQYVHGSYRPPMDVHGCLAR